jgi:hypothetical protein
LEKPLLGALRYAGLPPLAVLPEKEREEGATVVPPVVARLLALPELAVEPGAVVLPPCADQPLPLPAEGAVAVVPPCAAKPDEVPDEPFHPPVVPPPL